MLRNAGGLVIGHLNAGGGPRAVPELRSHFQSADRGRLLTRDLATPPPPLPDRLSLESSRSPQELPPAAAAAARRQAAGTGGLKKRLYYGDDP